MNNNNNPKNKSVKQIISDLKDHANMADASYAFLNNVFENEKKWTR